MNGGREHDKFRTSAASTDNKRIGEADVRSFDQLLDQLVDGELNASEYRSFVKSLDEHADGWRRCGLAFLESQAWRQDISAVRASEAPPGTSPVRPARGWNHAVIRWSAVAASWLVALSIGIWWPWPKSEILRQFDPFVAGNRPPVLPPLVAPGLRGDIVRPTMADKSGAPSGESLAGRQPAGEVEFVMAANGGDWQTSTRLPLRSFDQDQTGEASRDFWSEPQVVERLRQSGRKVNRQQEMVPFVLPDGRQILMPVEKVEVKPVRMPSY